LIVGLAEPVTNSTDRTLVDARFAVLVTGGHADPEDFSLQRVGQTQRVILKVPAPGDAVTIAIVAIIQQKRVPIDLTVPVHRPVVHVNVSPASILGYGLGIATVLVQGDENTKPGETVVLKTTAGTLDPMIVALDAQRVATATLRSTGRGAASVGLASGVTGSEGVTSITFTMPWLFMALAPLGGLLGTAIRVYGKKHRTRTRQSRHPVRRLLWTGVGLSFLGAVLWALGLQVLPFPWSPSWSEAGAFAVSGIVGFFGSLHFPGSPSKG
jgi:hypothetical protein